MTTGETELEATGVDGEDDVAASDGSEPPIVMDVGGIERTTRSD